MCKPESLCCTVEIGTTLQINCSSIKKKKKPSHSYSGSELASAGSVTLLHALWQLEGEGVGGMEVVGTNSQPNPECEMCLCRGIWNLPRLF